MPFDESYVLCDVAMINFLLQLKLPLAACQDHNQARDQDHNQDHNQECPPLLQRLELFCWNSTRQGSCC